MKFNRESALERAKSDLADRLGIKKSEIAEKRVNEREFPDMSLGAPEKGEMAAQMISSGWQIELAVNGRKYEYRADKYQLRLHNFEGENHVIKE
jgi:hypothetical protein